MPGLVAERRVAGRASASAGTGQDDCAGSPTMVQVAPRPRRPTIRHCIGVRSWASSMSTCAKPSSSTRLVGGRPAARAGVLPVGGGEDLVQRGVGEAEPLVVDRAGVDERRVAEQVAQLVEQRDVVDRELVAPRLGQQPDGLVVEDALGDPGRAGRGRAASRARWRRRAAATRRRRSRGTRRWCASRRRSPPWCARAPRSLRTWRHRCVDQRRGDLGGRPVARAHREQLAAHRRRARAGRAGARRRGRTPGTRGGRPGTAWRAVRRSTSAIAAEPLTSATAGVVAPGRAHAVDDVAERAQRDRGLAQGRQHPLDVAHEDPGRTDDEDAAGLVAAAVAVEEVGRAVQRDDGLAGAGTAGDQHDALVGGADRPVLLGLDGRHDRVHRAVAGPGELRQQGALADDRQARSVGLGVEQVVLDAEHALALAAQDPAPDTPCGSAWVAW